MKKDRIYISICSRGLNNNFLELLKCINKNYIKSNFDIRVLITFNLSKKINFFDKKLIKSKLKKINFKIIYEKQVGISKVRNRSLSYLKKLKFIYCCFLDDDCVIKDNYLEKHLNFIKKNKCNIVSGPQIYKSKMKFFKAFERNFSQGEEISWASTNNVFFKKDILKYNLIFSNKVSRYGFGEDQLFFSKLSNYGEVIKWNNNPVFEVSQKKRESLNWFINRNYRYGLTGILVDRELYNLFSAYILNIFKAFYNLARSLLCLFFSPIDLKNNLYKSLAFFLRFIGRILNIVRF